MRANLDHLLFGLCLAFSFACGVVGADDKKDPPAAWDVENPPGPTGEQAIDVEEGTWMNLDVSPEGDEIVFDLLGDLYVMPIQGCQDDEQPRKLTSGISWDMQPRFSPDGMWIAFTSDRQGKSQKSGDNIWIVRRDGTDLRQVTNETYRLLNNPTWSPDGNYIVARKHFTGRRSLGSGELWMYHRAARDANAMEGVQLTKKPNEQKNVNEPVYSRDGRYLFYSQDTTPGDAFEYDKDSNKQITPSNVWTFRPARPKPSSQDLVERAALSVTRRTQPGICTSSRSQDCSACHGSGIGGHTHGLRST